MSVMEYLVTVVISLVLRATQAVGYFCLFGTGCDHHEKKCKLSKCVYVYA